MSDRTRSRREPTRGVMICALLAFAASCRWPASRDQPTLVVAVPYELDTLDPHAEDRLSSFAILFNVYESLVDTDAEMRIRPGLAATWESPDPLTWVFHLRPSVTFASGKPLRAADVVYSLERLRGDKSLQIANFTRDVTEVEAPDDSTVRIRTATPSRVLLGKLRHVAIVPEGGGMATMGAGSDGTGPYVIDRWRRGDSVHLARNPHYGGPPPQIPEAQFLMGRGPGDCLEGLIAGRYRFVKCDTRKADEAAARSGRIVVRRHESLYVKYLAFDVGRMVTPFCNVRPNPFRDPRVRGAVAAAIERGRIVSRLPTDATPATQLISRAVLGFNRDVPEALPDRDLARRLLREAGLGSGFEVVLHARPFVREAAHAIQEDLREIGIRVEVREVSDEEHFGRLRRRDVTLWLTRIGCSSGDAGELFEDLIHSPDAAGRFGSLNDGGYSNPELDAEIERGLAIGRPSDRLAALKNMMTAVLRDNVVVPLYVDGDVYAMDRTLGWEPRSDSEIRVAEIALLPPP